MNDAPSQGVLASFTLHSGTNWLHLDRKVPEVVSWIRSEAGLDPHVSSALLAEETRPRCQRVGDAVLVILRGVNLNPGADPEDMVSIRIWASGERVLSCRQRRLMAVHDMEEALRAGSGPRTPGELLVTLADGLTTRMSGIVQTMEDEIDDIEELESPDMERRTKLRDLRRQAAILRRYIGPQRDALQRLASEELSWLDKHNRASLWETADGVTRLVEALNTIWERAAVLFEEMAAILAERTNERLYLLSIVAGIFLPLSFVTGLLGINVGGMPGVDEPLAFLWVCLLLLLLCAVDFWVFRRLRWI